MKYIQITITIAVIAMTTLLTSCNDADPNVPSGDPEILSISPATAHIGDTVTITGNYLGFGVSSASVKIGNNSFVGLNECVSWQTNQIKFRVPDSASSGDVTVNFSFTSSNAVALKVIKYPPIEVVEIVGKAFKMGSNSNSVDEFPEHVVTITKTLEVGKHEITQRQYSNMMRRNPSLTADFRVPVYNVSWLNAVQFCNALSKAQNLDTAYRFVGENVLWNENSNGWRLPTEAEWEFLCRAGTEGDFAGTGVINEMCWISDNSGLKPHPAGSKSPNQFGLYDMHGNVWEWCWDWYLLDYYSTSPTNDPKGPDFGSRHVIRGGSYNDGASYARSSNRTIPEILSNNIGFRIVRTKN
ncbi:MAG: SUMF1/EgtB/PvdO family nonheme iron enzyme [Desulfobulbaceae bacterium]|nr:SUMF1/EgtB/PvdO family nonheme iron enzyme [Desulfobulbaceae bacterium]